MLYCQSLASYNKIGSHGEVDRQRLMTDVPNELDRLYSLDPQAITEIHKRYYPEIYRFARFRVSDIALAEDITGDVFMRLLEAVHQGHGPKTNLRGWLFRTTANIVSDHYRKKYRRAPENPTEIHENSMDLFVSQEDPALVSDRGEREKVIKTALEKLTDAQKLVITLRFANRLSIEETAIIMGKNENTVKALQYRALVSLRRNIGNEFE